MTVNVIDAGTMQPEKKQAVFTVTKDHEKVSHDWLLLRLPGNTTPPTIS